MARKRSKKRAEQVDQATADYLTGLTLISHHPLFVPLRYRTNVYRHEGNLCPKEGWAVVTSHGAIHTHPTRRGTPEEWAYILAHCLLHLGFGHFQVRDNPAAWNKACDCVVDSFLLRLKFGRPPEEIRLPPELIMTAPSEERLYQQFCEEDSVTLQFGTAGPLHNDMIILAAVERPRGWPYQPPDWQACLAEGLATAVTSAVNVAAGLEPYLGAHSHRLTPAQRARNWFMSSYPLLGALAAAFEIIEEPTLCGRMDIMVAAIDDEAKEIYMNPAAGLMEMECRFVMAHELLHAGLRHQARRQGREPYLWNVACDYVINDWLVEMRVGDLPQMGLLYDDKLRGLSAEAIYDQIVTDMRAYRKLATLRGIGLGDMLERGRPDWWAAGEGMTLDEFYRRCLGQGLVYHQDSGRGLLPAGLIEEIRALDQPPIAWDVELARWFDEHFPLIPKVRSYARPSRRQSATPEIPRPSWIVPPDAYDGRTFGVVLDTSGSMDRKLLAKALGAIASYSLSRDVPAARVVFCDAITYDQGYMPPETIAGQVKVRGRGGTILQPAIDLLEKAADFPKDGPLLIITDGYCDRLTIRRDHAFLMPEGRNLPFVAKGPVFRIK
jgi:predicted metal-dependent peptidase